MKEPIESGLYRISNEEYHSGPGISKSGLSRILRSPAHFKTPQKETQALFDGQAFHVGCLEPKRFKEEYIVLPDDCRPRSGKGMKERKEEFMSYIASTGKTIIVQETIDMINGMRESLEKSSHAMELLSEGEAELSGYVYDPENPEILLKARFDWLNKKNEIMVDLKSTTNARPEAIIKDAYKYHWDMQAFLYLYVITHITQKTHEDFYFIAIEKEAPFALNIFKPSSEFINHGGKRIYQAIGIYKQCIKSKEWPSYSPDIKSLELPRWVEKEENAIFE